MAIMDAVKDSAGLQSPLHEFLNPRDELDAQNIPCVGDSRGRITDKKAKKMDL